jgi:alpha-2-macroglobulin
VDGPRCYRGCDPDRWNGIELRNDVEVSRFASALTLTDLTDAKSPQPVSRAPRPPRSGQDPRDSRSVLTVEDAGYAAQPPARTYQVSIDAGLQSADGQTLGYTWAAAIENWHQSAFTSFGDGHGVWETSGGPVLPFYARNTRTVSQWAVPLRPEDLMPTIRRLEPQFNLAPETAATQRKLGVTPDRVQSHGFDLSPSLARGRTGVFWAAVRRGTTLDRTHTPGSALRASLVQVTNLGITVKDSPHNTLVFVTRLDNGLPVPGAKVSIIDRTNSVFWSGTTGTDGVAMGPGLSLRDRRRSASEDYDDWWGRVDFIVTAEKDGDLAFVGSNWDEGLEPWSFNVSYSRLEAEPLLRGSVFSDRGVYRLGEEVHFKTILRHNTPNGVRLLPEGTAVSVALHDSRNRLVDERTVNVNSWSSAEWTLTLPADGALGSYSVRAVLLADRPKPRAPENLEPGEEPGPEADAYIPYQKVVRGSFLVAAYRRPDFRVDLKLTADQPIAGQVLAGSVSARYLFGGAMRGRPVTWTFSRAPVYTAPTPVRETFPEDRWLFVGWPDGERDRTRELRRDDATTTAAGELQLKLETTTDSGLPFSYLLEADVEDVSRQHIANRASIVVHPAPWYIGVRRPAYFVAQKEGLKTQIVAVTPDGHPAAGVPVEVTLTQVQWTSVRRAEGNGFYTWDTERKEVPAGSWSVTTGADPVALDIPIPNGGYFLLAATGREPGGRFAVTRTSFYATGDGYTAWARHDHNRIELVSDRRTYKPGDSATIMIQSPWEQATALLTIEREGVKTHRQFLLTSTQQSIQVPITELDIPNVYVSVLLVKGRTQAPPDDTSKAPANQDLSDPGKPAFRLGYVELQVEDGSKRLTVAVRANSEEYRPAHAASVRLDVKDVNGRGAPAEVTLWAVDYGVLSLTAYQPPDVLGSVYVHKSLQVLTVDSRQRIISRRVLTPKGETDGGGGGDPGAAFRKDFRVLAFWLGSVTTDAYGRGSVDVKLPESLTTYRIMAVAADRSSRFGFGDTEVRVNKPLTLKPTFPRFLAVGDTAIFGAVVTNQLQKAGTATVTIRSLDRDVLDFPAPAQQAIEVPAGGSVEVRFSAQGRAIGRGRVQMTVKLEDETDAFEDAIPVEILASAETVAAYGEARDGASTATESLTIPDGVVRGFGGLHLEMSSTAMVGLGEGARYLVEYPYGCAEQKGSRALALVLAADLGEAFTLPGIDTAKMKPAVQQTMRDLEKFQCTNGGFVYWPGGCPFTSPYLTSYLLHVFKVATDFKYDVDRNMVVRAYTYLERELAAPPPENEGWWPAYTAWQAFAIKVLIEGGRTQDSNLNRVYGYRDRMPVFALAYLHDAMLAKGETGGARVEDLRRRMANAILPEGGSAHVEELSDPYLLWFWNSNVRSTAIVLNSFVKAEAQAPITSIVRWMMAARKNGRWSNTQENATAMEALVAYYRKYEKTVPDFRAVVALGGEELARETFKGRSTTAESTNVPMPQLLAKGAPGAKRPLTFTREGAGTLFYTARLRYAADRLYQDGLDQGIHIERTYEPYVETGSKPPTTAYKAGDLVRVTLTFRLTKERRYVAVVDPLPAGFEPVESWFATTAAALKAATDQQNAPETDWQAWWRRGGFDYVERFDDRVQLFGTRLSEGRHEFSYIVRATTAGTFRTAPARAEEMYEPEVFGRTPTAVIDVKR